MPTLVEFLESLEPDLPALRAMGLHLWATGPETNVAGISNLLSEAADQVDEPVPGYLSAPQNIMDTCLYIFTSGTTGEDWIQYFSDTEAEGGKVWGEDWDACHFQITLDTIPGTASLLPVPKIPIFPGHSSDPFPDCAPLATLQACPRLLESVI